MLPINRIVNCERVLETGEYQLLKLGNQYNGIEDLWLMKYLMVKGYSKKEIREKIRPIHEKEYGYMDERLFSLRYRRANRIKLEKYGNKIEIYESEMNAINHMNVPMLQKKFAMCVVCFFKAANNSEHDYGEIMRSGIKKFVNRTDRHDYSDYSRCIDAMKECGLLQVRLEEPTKDDGFDYYYDFSDDGSFEYSYDAYEDDLGGDVVINPIEYVKLADPSGEVKFTLDTLIDVGTLYDKILPVACCSKCGKEYVVSKDCKRDVCLECWKARHEEGKREYDPEPIFGQRFCTSCGKAYDVNGRSKRTICAECWKKKERERIKNAVKMHRARV